MLAVVLAADNWKCGRTADHVKGIVRTSASIIGLGQIKGQEIDANLRKLLSIYYSTSVSISIYTMINFEKDFGNIENFECFDANLRKFLSILFYTIVSIRY